MNSFTILIPLFKLISCVTFENVTVIVRNIDSSEKVLRLDWDSNFNRYVNKETTRVIDIKRQFMPELEANSFSDLPQLRVLTLTDNSIRQIEPGAFRNLPSLEVLNLTNNEIEEIKNGVFDQLQVRELYLQRNKIFRIGHNAFNNLTLTRISLRDNRITRWNREWFSGSRVGVLDVGGNLIEELPPNAFLSMKLPLQGNLSVYFSYNRIKVINRDAFNGFGSFSDVFLDGNLIERLRPGVFDGVAYVRRLNLNNNGIEEIDVNLFNGTRIDVLMLEDNRLRCLSTDIFQMEELDIDGNPITCSCVKVWLDWRSVYSHPSIYHIVNIEQDCI